MTKTDSLQQFHALRSALVAERKELQDRLANIEAALGGAEGPPQPPQKSSPPSQPAPANNAVGLRETIRKAVAKQPLSVREIVKAAQQSGYTFASANPVNSVGAYLYGSGKKHFVRKDGKFSVIGSGGSEAAKTSSAPVAKQKRKMSPQARKKIAAAMKARWAKVRAEKN